MAENTGVEEGSYRTEVIRKTIHFSSISIPIFYFFTPRDTALPVAVILTAVVFLVDIGRLYFPPVTSLFNKIFGTLLRRHESHTHSRRLTGATYVLIAATLSIFLFPKLIAITSFLILILADMAAALIGRKFGATPLFGKSVEGSAAFFAVALLVIGATPKIAYVPGEYIIGCVAALAGTIVEALPIRIDDNLSVPLAVGFVLWAGYAFLLPHLDVYRFG